MGELENGRIRKLANEMEATRNALAKRLSVYSTLPKVVARQAFNFAKV